MQANNKKFQIIILGDDAVGKTSLLRMYSEKKYSPIHLPTIGLDFVTNNYKSPDGDNILVKIWDTAGQERFKTITYTFYKQANGVIVTFDITN